MTPSTMARPTNVRTRLPPPPEAAAWVWSADGRLSGVASPFTAARAAGAASSMPAQAARKAVVRVGNIGGRRPGRGRWGAKLIGPAARRLEAKRRRRPEILSDAHAGGRRHRTPVQSPESAGPGVDDVVRGLSSLHVPPRAGPGAARARRGPGQGGLRREPRVPDRGRRDAARRGRAPRPGPLLAAPRRRRRAERDGPPRLAGVARPPRARPRGR